MMDLMLKGEVIALGLLAIAFVVQILVKPYLQKNNVLTAEQIELIDYACEKGVGYAEKLYLEGEDIDRGEVAVDYAFDVIEKAGIIPNAYLGIIEGIIKDKVRQLPPTTPQIVEKGM